MRGEKFQVIVGGKKGSVDGTSASTSVFAGMVALLNAERERRGGGW